MTGSHARVFLFMTFDNGDAGIGVMELSSVFLTGFQVRETVIVRQS